MRKPDEMQGIPDEPTKMSEKDLKKLAQMKADGKDDEAIVSFFKVLGYQEPEVRQYLTAVKPAKEVVPRTPQEGASAERRNIAIYEAAPKKRSPLKKIIAALSIVLCLVLAGYFVPKALGLELPEAPLDIKARMRNCTANSTTLKIEGSNEISGFTVKENNATCSVLEFLEAGGEGGVLECTGSFSDGKDYTLVKGATEEEFTCTYQ